VYDKEFYSLFHGSTLPKVDTPFHTENYAFAHEGPVYLSTTNEVFMVSNRLRGQTLEPASNLDTDQSVRMHALSLFPEVSPGKRLRRIQSDIKMANGATINCTSGELLVLSQGIGNWKKSPRNFTPSGIHRLNPYTGASSVLLNNAYGLPFNSLNDIVMTGDGTVWITDPVYGYEQGFLTGEAALPNAIWSLSPKDAGPRLMQMKTISRPNGLAVAPDQKTIYATDTGESGGDMISRTVYAHKVINKHSGTPFLSNPHPLYFAEDGIPDGIKTDSKGNVYMGQGNGLAVVSPRGLLLGKILTPRGTGVTQVVFAGPNFDQLLLLCETKVWKVPMRVRAALTLRC